MKLRMKLSRFFKTVGLAVMTLAGSAHASIINDLHNTGVNLVAGAEDVNYLVTDSNITHHPYGTSNTNYPLNCCWLQNSAASEWLAPSSNSADAFAAISYDWSTSFDLTGFSPLSASFNGRFSADDSAVAYLNGHQIGISRTFSYWDDFASQSSFFMEGINNITFVVHNGAGPTGLRVEFLNSDVTAVPEPETYTIVLAGLAALGFVTRRKGATKA